MSVRLVRELDDGPIVGTKEEGTEELFVKLEDELNESTESVLFDGGNVVLVERCRVNTTKVEDGEEQFEDDTVVLDNVGSLAMSKGAVEQVEETEDRLKRTRRVSDRYYLATGRRRLTARAFPSREA